MIMDKMFVTLFGVGLVKYAPGTVSSAVSIVLWLILFKVSGPIMILGILLMTFFLSLIFISNYLRKVSEEKDPGEIVIDELIGQWISLTPIFFFKIGETENFIDIIRLSILSFFLFRLFDIWKPWPVKVFDQGSGPLYIILDDIVAGLFAAAILLGYMVWTN